MKFRQLGVYSGYTAPSYVRDYIYTDNLIYEQGYQIYIVAAENREKNKDDKLQITWILNILYHDGELFDFYMKTKYFIEERETEPSDIELENMIRASYQTFIEYFDMRRVEFRQFAELNKPSPEVFQLALERLKECVLSQIQH